MSKKGKEKNSKSSKTFPKREAINLNKKKLQETSSAVSVQKSQKNPPAKEAPADAVPGEYGEDKSVHISPHIFTNILIALVLIGLLVGMFFFFELGKAGKAVALPAKVLAIESSLQIPKTEYTVKLDSIKTKLVLEEESVEIKIGEEIKAKVMVPQQFPLPQEEATTPERQETEKTTAPTAETTPTAPAPETTTETTSASRTETASETTQPAATSPTTTPPTTTLPTTTSPTTTSSAPSTLATDKKIYAPGEKVAITGACSAPQIAVGLRAALEGNNVWTNQAKTDEGSKYAASFSPQQKGTYTVYAACRGETALTAAFCVGTQEECQPAAGTQPTGRIVAELPSGEGSTAGSLEDVIKAGLEEKLQAKIETFTKEEKKVTIIFANGKNTILFRDKISFTKDNVAVTYKILEKTHEARLLVSGKQNNILLDRAFLSSEALPQLASVEGNTLKVSSIQQKAVVISFELQEAKKEEERVKEELAEEPKKEVREIPSSPLPAAPPSEQPPSEEREQQPLQQQPQANESTVQPAEPVSAPLPAAQEPRNQTRNQTVAVGETNRTANQTVNRTAGQPVSDETPATTRNETAPAADETMQPQETAADENRAPEQAPPQAEQNASAPATEAAAAGETQPAGTAATETQPTEAQQTETTGAETPPISEQPSEGYTIDEYAAESTQPAVDYGGGSLPASEPETATQEETGTEIVEQQALQDGSSPPEELPPSTAPETEPAIETSPAEKEEAKQAEPEERKPSRGPLLWLITLVLIAMCVMAILTVFIVKRKKKKLPTR